MCGGFGFINMFYTENRTVEDELCGNTTQDTYYQKWFEDVGHCTILEAGNYYGFTFYFIELGIA